MDESLNKNIWAYIDTRNQRHLGLSLRVLGAARRLAVQAGCKTVAVLPGVANPAFKIEHIIETCISRGADMVYALEHADLAPPRADVHAQILDGLIQDQKSMAFLFALTDLGREIAAQCASMIGAGVIADCVALAMEDGHIIADSPSWGGEIMARLSYSDHNLTCFATVQPVAFQEEEVKGVPGAVKRITVKSFRASDKMTLISSSERASEHRSLEEAEVVVAGGAGVATGEGFGMIRSLAAALGGEVGATRPPIINHWVGEERLIGQTGKTVHPNLLITVGTSGAVQFTSGIRESKSIIAINRDPDSPIFNIADVGVVADSRRLLPVILTQVKKALMRDIADELNDNRTQVKTENAFGEKVRRLRNAHGWSIDDLAAHTGQTPEFIQEAEAGRVVPSVSFLLSISKALDVDPGTFLKDEEKTAIKGQRAQAFTIRNRDYAYQTLTPDAEHHHLRSFMITIDPRQAHKSIAYKHEGEEFVYVMEGHLELTLGNKVSEFKAGESVHFNSETPHKLRNICDETTRCLVVLYTP
jgi:electron transfer flavoprotein alpha subunit